MRYFFLFLTTLLLIACSKSNPTNEPNSSTFKSDFSALELQADSFADHYTEINIQKEITIPVKNGLAEFKITGLKFKSIRDFGKYYNSRNLITAKKLIIVQSATQQELSDVKILFNSEKLNTDSIVKLLQENFSSVRSKRLNPSTVFPYLSDLIKDNPDIQFEFSTKYNVSGEMADKTPSMPKDAVLYVRGNAKFDSNNEYYADFNVSACIPESALKTLEYRIPIKADRIENGLAYIILDNQKLKEVLSEK